MDATEPPVYLPIVMEPFSDSFTLSKGLGSPSGQPITITLQEMPPPDCDTGDKLLPLCYVDALVVIICFSIDEPEGLSSAKEKWEPEVRHYTRNRTPVILLGLKKDLRSQVKEGGRGSIVDLRQAKEAAQGIGAQKYMECSSLTGEGTTEVIQEAAYLALVTSGVERSNSGCIIT